MRENLIWSDGQQNDASCTSHLGQGWKTRWLRHGHLAFILSRDYVGRKCNRKWDKKPCISNLYIYFIYWLHHAICGILVPWPEIKPVTPAREAQILTTGLPGKHQPCISRIDFAVNLSLCDPVLSCIFSKLVSRNATLQGTSLRTNPTLPSHLSIFPQASEVWLFPSFILLSSLPADLWRMEKSSSSLTVLPLLKQMYKALLVLWQCLLFKGDGDRV